jgi:hypothetical protein
VPRRRQPLRRLVAKLAWLAVPIGLAGELGHQVLERAGRALAHHLFHVAFGLGAALVFLTFVLVDVRRHGPPTFSWRIGSERRPAAPTR